MPQDRIKDQDYTVGWLSARPRFKKLVAEQNPEVKNAALPLESAALLVLINCRAARVRSSDSLMPLS